MLNTYQGSETNQKALEIKEKEKAEHENELLG